MMCRRFISNVYISISVITNRSRTTLQSNFMRPFEKITTHKCLFQKLFPSFHIILRFRKHKKDDFTVPSELIEELEEEKTDDLVEPYEKVISTTVPSLRLDSILKGGLGLSRNKADLAFYERKVRVNGNKVMKKSMEIKEGDEIDLYVGKSSDNPNLIIVHRAKLISEKLSPSGFKVRIVKDKNLVIEKYKDFDLDENEVQ